MLENCQAYCEQQNIFVDVLVNKQKRNAKNNVVTPIRCQYSANCSKTLFCRFINPLTTRMPLDFDTDKYKNAS